MIYNCSFPSREPKDSSCLPLTLISLEDWVLVTLEGPDAMEYLQSQITADIYELAPDQHVLCGHCNAKGKMWSTLRLFRHGDGFAYLERHSVLSSQLAAIKKYALFSRVTIATDNNLVLLGIAGFQAREILARYFSVLPDVQHQVVQEGGTTLLQFTDPTERFLLITSGTLAVKLATILHNQVEFNNSCQWLTLDIEAGYPIIDSANSTQMIPQATNLQALQGVSFSKGCYIGQEIVARTKFCGLNKRAMYWLEGKAGRTPKVAEHLELQLGKTWRRTGIVLAANTLVNGMLWVQVVMSKNLDANSKLRVSADNNSELIIKRLPYNLEF